LPEAYTVHVDSVLGVVDFEVSHVNSLPGLAQQDLQDMQGKQAWGYATFEDLSAAKQPGIMTPALLKKIYNAPPPATRGTRLALERANTTQVVYATLGQYWSPSDRALFERSMSIPEDNYVRQFAGNSKSGDEQCRVNPNFCAEANLDVQYMMAMAPWARLGYWYVHEADAQGMYNFLNKFIQRFVDSDEVPHVISISYGMPEFSVSNAARYLFELLSMILAMRGVTIVVASGDDGAASFLARKVNAEGETCWFVPKVGLQVSWPACSAWVTSVGATIGAEIGQAEAVCQVNASGPSAASSTLPLITTGGGFSQAIKVPAWQEGHHDRPFRGVPDLALAGHSFAS